MSEMTAEQLADFLGITDLAPDAQARFIAGLSPEKRATFERMHEVVGEIHLWEAGIGPRPTGVILCGPKQIRERGR